MGHRKPYSFNNIIFLLKTIITIIVIGLLIWFLLSNKEVIDKIRNVNIKYFILLIIISIIDLIINGFFLKTVVKPFKIDLKEHFLLSSASTFLNQIIPIRGGDGMRALYFKQKHKLNYFDYISTIFGYLIITFFYLSLLSLVVFFVIYITEGIFNITVNFILITIFIGCLWMVIKPVQLKKENFITEKINYGLKGWKTISEHKKTLFSLIIISAISSINMIIKHYIGFLSIGINLSMIKVAYIYIIIKLVAFINITPGGLGFIEGAYLISGSILNIDIESMFALAIIIRGINIIVISPIGLIAYFYLINKLDSSK